MSLTATIRPETEIAILGHHRHVSLDKFLKVMQSLLWLEETCARSGTRWNDFKYGLGEGLYRDRESRRNDPAHVVTLRLHRVFGSGQSDFDAQVRTELSQKVSKQGGVGGPVALASGYENTYPLPNRPE